MSSTPREVGTLVVVVLKANHLPNKRHIGKQDPYCAVTFDGQTRRTKAIKKGGQHPEWDEEIRFQLYEDDSEHSEVEQATSSGTPPPLPPKNDKSLKIKGGMFMKLAAYADDAREPDLIGEGLVDLSEVITKGESDEWYTLTYKDRFAGKVYLEMTLYSNEPEPPKKKKAAVLTNNSEYIGPGVFVEETSGGATNRIVSASVAQGHNRRQSDSYSIRPSSSLAQLDLYQAPYEQNISVDSLTRNFGEFGVSNGRRRETHPASVNSYRSTSSTGLSTVSSRSSLYEPNGSTFRPVTPNGQLPYPGDYEPNQPQPQPSSYRPPPPVRKTRYSIPTSSSGFVPISNSSSSLHSSTSSSYNMPLPTGNYPPPLPSQTPLPTAYNPPPVMYDSGGYPQPPNGTFPIPFDTGAYPPAPSQTPFPTSYTTNVPQSQSFDNGHTLSPTEPYTYPHQGSLIIPPPPPLPSQLVPPAQSNSPDLYTGYTVPSPSRDVAGSRPLPPQPQGVPLPPPPVPLDQQQYGTSYMNLSGPNGFSQIPPPPPPIPSPQSQSPLNGSPQSHFSTDGRMPSLPSKNLPVPPPPQTPIRRASLPQPPIQAASYPPLPQPPSVSDFRNIPPPPPPTSQPQSFHPGPPPRPPVQSVYYHDPASQHPNVYNHYQG
ncbi:hypothetical protein EV361DRAFT_930019 [Lentinula raphanica]|uniref:C2 domain-containing protein n=1 Tax=Lentinula raphanica TaxID=153919 RepID=A0AA38PDQ8_9AGAR|nr:hypothetical protein FB446DRAFT_714030 [Lentinula raphanica]KAJ3841038.1 hypothetical protein F5878DRAFT_611391 [Lentinula raphanica]KAJ3967559.1 hypothetical protein EV361DRAFT_930019 [Lentinula raphanica]